MSCMDVRSHSVRHRRDNLWMRSDAGPLVSREFLSAYISGYADGEGCFTSPSHRERRSRRLGGEAELLRQSERKIAPRCSTRCRPIQVRKHPAGSQRQDAEVETRKLDDLVERVVPQLVASYRRGRREISRDYRTDQALRTVACRRSP